MPLDRRALSACLVVVLFVASCGESSPSPIASTTATAAPSSARPLGTPRPTLSPTEQPSSAAAVSPSPSSKATPKVVATPAPAGPGGFVTPYPPDAARAWTGIHWRRLRAADQLAHVESMTRWAGGYVAIGDVDATAAAHSRVWVSADGGTWELLGADVLGPSTIALGAAPTPDGVVVLTLQSSGGSGGGDSVAVDTLTLTGQLQTWTTSNGTDWTAHPGPDVALPEEVDGDTLPQLVAGTPGLLAVVPTETASGIGSRMAISDDGVGWDVLPRAALPQGWRTSDVVATSTGFVALMGTLALTSTDGRTWRKHPISSSISVGNEYLVAGPRGVVASGLRYEDNGAGTWFWWASTDGRSWRTLSDYPPLGAMTGRASQECEHACPDGILVGDGARMIAYRGWKTQIGWTSSNGRSWRRLAFTGHPERSIGWLDDNCTGSLILLPVGVMCTDSREATWFGTPTT